MNGKEIPAGPVKNHEVPDRSAESPLERREAIWLAGIMAVAVLFRLFLLRYIYAAMFDEVNYLKLAAAGAYSGIARAVHTFWSPFYPLVVSMVTRIFGSPETSARIVSVICGSLVILPLYFFARGYLSKKTALMSAVFVAVYPPIAFQSTGARTESLYTLLIVTGIVLGWTGITRKKGFNLAGAGVCFSLAYLTRPEGIGFFGVLSLILLGSVFLSRKNRIFFIRALVLAGAAFVFCAAPYVIYLKGATGHWTLSGKQSTQQGSVYAMTKQEGEEDEFRILSEDNTTVPIDQVYHLGTFDRAHGEEGKPLVRVTPKLFIIKYFKNLYEVVKSALPRVFTTLLFALMILGLFGSPWSRGRAWRELYLLSFVLFFWFVVIPMFHVNDRYFYPFFPVVMIWAARGVEHLIAWLAGTLKPWFAGPEENPWPVRLASLATTLVLLGILFFPEAGKIVSRTRWATDYWHDPVEQKEAGLWLRERAEKPPVIMSRNHAVDFYAGNYHITQSVTIPQNSLDRVLAYARYRGVEYMVLNERYIRDYPKLKPLLGGKDVPGDLELVYDRKDPSGLKTVIYRVLPEKEL
jgi:4-amino-4-deoxy-L-arabinose transferase-like glycosyltransferase